MREPFPYESNALLLSKFLVPEPLSRTIWKTAVEKWENTGRDGLLQMLIEDGILEEATYLKWMSQVMGCEIVDGPERVSTGYRSPENTLLEQNRFVILDDRPGRKVVAGGPDLPPRLGKYLGSRSCEWKWVLQTTRSGNESVKDKAADRKLPKESVASSTGQWLEELLLDCRARSAADLHLERTGQFLSIRMRTPVGMHAVGHWSGEHATRRLRLLKSWSGLPTTETALPADGRLTRCIAGKNHTYRVSQVATTDGESLVLRQLGEESDIRSLSELLVPDRLREAMRSIVLADAGMILFTGPTGSGKTTTLYGFLASLKDESLKIMSIEDPVEYELSHLTQSPVDEGAGWTFARAVRAYMRQDPDVIVPGEIRDRDSAEAACRAALTGHSVLTTLHARDAKMAMERLRGWGIPDSILQETVHLVINQRLEASDTEGSRRARYSWIQPFASG